MNFCFFLIEICCVVLCSYYFNWILNIYNDIWMLGHWIGLIMTSTTRILTRTQFNVMSPLRLAKECGEDVVRFRYRRWSEGACPSIVDVVGFDYFWSSRNKASVAGQELTCSTGGVNSNPIKLIHIRDLAWFIARTWSAAGDVFLFRNDRSIVVQPCCMPNRCSLTTQYDCGLFFFWQTIAGRLTQLYVYNTTQTIFGAI